MSEATDRVAHIDSRLSAIKGAWPHVVAEIDALLLPLMEKLMNSEDEQTRGRIKALRELKELPVLLLQEREGISAALSEQDAAD